MKRTTKRKMILERDEIARNTIIRRCIIGLLTSIFIFVLSL
jgi:hypothetical protein